MNFFTVSYDNSRDVVFTHIDLPSKYDIKSESGIEMMITCPAICVPIIFDGEMSEITFIIDQDGEYAAFSGFDNDKHFIIVKGEEGDERRVELDPEDMLRIGTELEHDENIPIIKMLDMCKYIIDLKDQGIGIEIFMDY